MSKATYAASVTINQENLDAATAWAKSLPQISEDAGRDAGERIGRSMESLVALVRR